MASETGDGGIRILRPGKTLRELALDKLRSAILERYFEPGDRLVERDLCAELGVSRTIVREALRHLESEGLVANAQGRGPVVAETSPEEAWQIYEIRASLEAMAARACAERREPKTVAALEAALAAIRAGYEARDYSGILAATTEFYRVLFAGAERDIAWGIVSSLTARINHLRSMTIKTERRDVEGPGQMGLIVEAIRDGDREAAAAAATKHVEKASSIARALLEERSNAEAAIAVPVLKSGRRARS